MQQNWTPWRFRMRLFHSVAANPLEPVLTFIVGSIRILHNDLCMQEAFGRLLTNVADDLYVRGKGGVFDEKSPLLNHHARRVRERTPRQHGNCHQKSASKHLIHVIYPLRIVSERRVDDRQKPDRGAFVEIDRTDLNPMERLGIVEHADLHTRQTASIVGCANLQSKMRPLSA